MRNNFFGHDFGQNMDKVFEAVNKCGRVWKDEFEEMFKNMPFDEGFVDFYPGYSYPPVNSFIDKDKNLVFEFALAGFTENDVKLTFQGDFMVFSATAPVRDDDNIQYFKKRLKFKDITEQKYYVPKSKFNQENVSASFKNGLLKVVISPKADETKDEEIKVNIKSKDCYKGRKPLVLFIIVSSL